jgi:hypothetical protein
VDALGRLRKLRLSLDLSGAATRLRLPAAMRPKIDATVEFYDFGVPVNVVVPQGAKSAVAAAQDRAAQIDLRNALTAEKTVYVDSQSYSGSRTALQQIEPSLDWGGNLSFVVGRAGGNPDQVVCLSERSKSGTTYALADVASGPQAGTFFATTACPAVVTDASFSSFTSRW